MPENKHTPWLWEVGTNMNGKVAVFTHADNKGAIAVMTGRDEDQANAKLISAAPELLEALETLKSWVGKLSDWEGADPPCELVDAAIKKATLCK